MIFFIIRRLILTVFLLLLVSMITFAIFFLVPRLAGQTSYQLAAQYVGRNPIPSAIKAVEIKLGLNAPVYLQYGRFVKGIVAGVHYNNGPDVSYCPFPCFGYSFRNQEPVWPQLVSDAPVTLSLAIGGAVLWLIGGVSIGVLSALRRGSFFDRLSMGIALAGVSLPVFFTGLISLETMGEDYIRTARAKGLPERKVIVKHGMRAALTPIVTIFGLDLGLLLGGAILTETTFSFPGLGQFTILAIQNQDLPEIQGVVMIAAFFIVIANMIVDILYAVVDPRVRF
jgi:peptide/nickel transport system permease protein